MRQICGHRYSQKIEDVVAEHIKYSRQEAKGKDSEWKVVEDDGEMSVFIRETEMDGITCDPIKAAMVVEGVSAFEICDAFFSPQYRMLWETSLDSSEVVETLDKDTMVFHQKHTKVWPAAQRDTVALTHIRPIAPLDLGPAVEEDEEEEDDSLDWITVNFSILDREAEIPVGKCVRAKVNGSMLCRTRFRSKTTKELLPRGRRPDEAVEALSRDQLSTTVVYQSYVDAGGWVPAAGVRALAKREYPKFVRKFSDFVKKQNQGKKIRFRPHDGNSQ